MQAHTSRFLFLVLLIIWAAIIGVLFWPQITQRVSNEPIFCTLEAMICPDGSAVSRVAPRCEFAPCPSGDSNNNTSTADWIDSTGEVKFKYPPNLGTTYLTPNNWPPRVTVRHDSFVCEEGERTIDGLPTLVQKRLIGNRTYCVQARNEGAAGSLYADYTYTTEKDEHAVDVVFTIRYPQCLNYDEPKKTECQGEREAFDLDGLVDRMVSTVKVHNE